MSELILRNSYGQTVGQREMHESERYVFYRAWQTHSLIVFERKQYFITTVAWRLPEENLLLGVTFDSWEPCDC